MENAKQKAIEVAYEKILGEEKYNEIKDSIDEDGKCKKYHWFKSNYSEEFINSNFYVPVEIDNDKWVLPNSIKYIRTNNNWISIHSEDDLPKEKTIYEFIPCNNFNRKFIGWVDSELEEVFFVDFKSYKTEKIGRRDFTQLNAWLPSQITHYRELKNYDDKKPIY